MERNEGVPKEHQFEEYEAIVVGSGFGGAVAACRLAQVGYRTLILERGRRYEENDFPAVPRDAALLPDLRRWTWQRDQGLWDIQDLEEIMAVQAAGYGGGSLIYANVHLRPPDGVFATRWPAAYRDGALREYFNLAAYMLEPAPITTHPTLVPLRKARGLEQAMKDLGREKSFFHPPLAIRNQAGKNRHGREMKACDGCGRCCTGCPSRAKNTLDFNYLAVAEQFDAEVRTQCEVVDIVQREQRVWELCAIDHLGAKKVYFRTPSLFLCAGSVHSTRLLARVQFLRPDEPVKDRIGIGYYPGGDSLGVVFDTKEVQEPNFGPTITTTTVHWKDEKKADFFQIQDGGYEAELDRLIGMLRAPLWVGRNRHTDAVDVDRPEPRIPPKAADPRGVMPSPIDALLDAGKYPNRCHDRDTSAGMELVPLQLRKSFPKFLDELRRPMLLSSVVGGVIEDSIRALQQRCWLTRCLNPDNWFLKLLLRIGRWAIRSVLATDDQFADFAIRQLASGAHLPRDQYAARVLGYDASHSRYRTMLLGMGRDPAAGELWYDKARDRLIANLDLFYLTPAYTLQERLMADVAGKLGGELRTNPAWEFVGKPITVHNQGGCPMSEMSGDGVTDPDGQVHGCPGLYIMDGSVFCTSVGVNPSATIAAITERNIRRFFEKGPKPKNYNEKGRAAYAEAQRKSADWDRESEGKGWRLSPPSGAPSGEMDSHSVGVEFREHMEGSHNRTNEIPKTDDDYRKLESSGRGHSNLSVDLHVSANDLHCFLEDEEHRMSISGTAKLVAEGVKVEAEDVSGTLDLFVPRVKSYGGTSASRRRDAQRRLTWSNPASSGPRSYPEERLMTYSFTFDRGRYGVTGYKRIRNDPGLDAWRDVSSLFCIIFERDAAGAYSTWGAGVIHVDFPSFLFKQVPSMTVTGTSPDDPRNVWALAKFAAFFFGSLQRIYLPGAGSTLSTFFRITPPPQGR